MTESRTVSIGDFSALIASELEMDSDDLPVNVSLVKELGFDSIQFYEILVIIEDEYGVFLADEPLDFEALTLTDLCTALHGVQRASAG